MLVGNKERPPRFASQRDHDDDKPPQRGPEGTESSGCARRLNNLVPSRCLIFRTRRRLWMVVRWEWTFPNKVRPLQIALTGGESVIVSAGPWAWSPLLSRGRQDNDEPAPRSWTARTHRGRSRLLLRSLSRAQPQLRSFGLGISTGFPGNSHHPPDETPHTPKLSLDPHIA
jgi:hypothetical protein